MRTVDLNFTIPGRTAPEVFKRLSAFDRYPELCDAVQSVEIISDEVADMSISVWEVKFRSGLLRWVEQDTFDHDLHTIEFRQVEGDMALFDGSWGCIGIDGGTSLSFRANLDMGIPSLADALEPIAVRTLIENTASIISGLFGASAELAGPSLALAAAGGAK